jgi:tetratricopeptide (TPR) repeat protein
MHGNPVNSSNKDAFLQKAIDSHLKGNLNEAKDIYRAVLSYDPKNNEAIFRLGTMALQLKQYDKAAEYIKIAIDIGPSRIAMFINHGIALKNLEQFDKAIHSYDKALELNPNSVDALFNKGCTLQAQDKFNDAKKLYLKALSKKNDIAEIWINLGTVEKELGDNKSAIASFEKAGQLNPKLGAVYSNIGAIFFEDGLEKSALKLIEKAIELEPQNSEYLYRMSTFWLARGELKRGWKDYDKRFIHSKIAKDCLRPNPPPYWEGESIKELKNKNILFWTEQGLGEELISSSIINNLIDNGLKFSIECTSKLLPLLSRTYPSVKFSSWEDHDKLIKKSDESFDFQYPLFSTLKFFFNDSDAINSNGPSIKPSPPIVKDLRKKYEKLANGRRIIGISWKSGNKNFGHDKTIPLEAWKNILSFKDIFFINLQYGEFQEDIKKIKENLGVEIYCDPDVNPLTDLEATLGQIAAMDLVISVSNSNVHFAGSMGIPAWSIIPKSKGIIWFWFTKGTLSPWYPSVRLFRQTSTPEAGKAWWPAVVDDVTKELSSWLKKPPPSRTVS